MKTRLTHSVSHATVLRRCLHAADQNSSARAYEDRLWRQMTSGLQFSGHSIIYCMSDKYTAVTTWKETIFSQMGLLLRCVLKKLRTYGKSVSVFKSGNGHFTRRVCKVQHLLLKLLNIANWWRWTQRLATTWRRTILVRLQMNKPARKWRAWFGQWNKSREMSRWLAINCSTSCSLHSDFTSYV